MKRTLAAASAALLMASAAALPSPAAASTQAGVHVVLLVPNNAGVLKVFVDAARTGAPSCATETTTWVVDVNSQAGQTIAAGLYLALASGKTVDIAGIDLCNISAGVESIGYIAVHA